MSRLLVACLAAFVACTFPLPSTAVRIPIQPKRAEPARSDAVLDVAARVGGASQAALTVKWWQWAAAFEYAESPIADRTGERCAKGQEGEVFFLAGTYGSTPAQRTCHVPAGKHLFFPLINYVVMPASCDHCLQCEDAAANAQSMTDDAMGLFAELDGVSLPALDGHRVASPDCFDLAARAKSRTPIAPTATNGYWLLLKPLPAGTHKLRFGGSLPSLRQELVYTLIVE